MFKWLTTTKKGYTLVELMIVLVLLSLGTFALMNLFRVGYRAFNKSEERYIKQEAVKNVADILRGSYTDVAAAKTADIFENASVVPTKNARDKSYSYLFAEPHKVLDADGNETGKIDGYLIYNLNRNGTRLFKLSEFNAARKKGLEDIENRVTADGYTQEMKNKDIDDYKAQTQKLLKYYQTIYDFAVTADEKPLKPLSPIPIYVEIDAIRTKNTTLDKKETIKNECGVIVKLSALENDYDYDVNPTPTPDDIYYSLDVAYHFPNMVTDNYGTVVSRNYDGTVSDAPTYNNKTGAIDKKNTEKAVDTGGCVLRVYADAIISGDRSESELRAPSLCFIATASYGHDSGEVGMLCDFRDKCLLTNPLGTAFVKAYYAISPPIANFIAQNETLKAAVRLSLKPLIIVAEYALNPELRAEGIICLAVGLMSLSGATIVLMKFNKRKRKEKCKK